MPTKKKIGGRSARDLASTKVSRHPKKAAENSHVTEEKVTEIITSSARKQKVGVHSKNTREDIPATNLCATYGLTKNDPSDPWLDHNASNDVDMEMESKVLDGGNTHCVLDTIFSPTFNIPRGEEDIANGVDFIKFFQREEEKFQNSDNENLQLGINTGDVIQDQRSNETCTYLGATLSSEVSAIYLSMKNSKLECVEEQGQDHMSADVCVEEDEYEEFVDFDPYFFIKNLPDLSSVVPTFRPMLLPKQTRRCPPTSLVLDLDETLVHSTLEPCNDADFTFPVNFNLQEHTVYVRCRPHLQDFMERVASLFEIIIFTASQSIYAEQLLNVLDPRRKIIRHRVYRESCVFVEGNYLKDLSVLGRDLARVIIIDNSPQAFGFQVDNGIPIESWFDDRSDQELLSLLPFLESLVGVQDVRPLIAAKFNLRKKIASAVCPLICGRGVSF